MQRKKRNLAIGAAITGVYLLIQLLLMPHYGISWDFHYHLYGGLYHLGLPVPDIQSPAPVPFSPPDPRLTVADPFGPFTQIIPTLSYVLFSQWGNMLPFDSAYNLPIVLVGALGVGLLYLILLEWFDVHHAVVGALFLALLPVHFDYLHTDMKDVPNAFAFTLSIYLFWRLLQYRRARDLLFAVGAFAIAFNIKINSILIPVVCGLFFIWQWVIARKHWSWMGASWGILAPLAALLLWWPFWDQPLAKLAELPVFYSRNTINMPVLLNGVLYRSGVNIPWYYPFVYIAITTPLSIFLSFLMGLGIALWGAVKKNDRFVLLLLWFMVPVLRYLFPRSPAIDGVRHFMEIVYPLCALGAVGLVWGMRVIRRDAGIPVGTRFLVSTVIVIVFVPLVWNIVHFHPYQNSFFSVFAGGIKGAQGKWDIDFWGTPQREAIWWLNQHAPENATVHIVMGQSSAAMYLRPDLQSRANSKTKEESDYTVVLNRESFFSIYGIQPYLDTARSQRAIVFTKDIDTVPLVWVIKNHEVLEGEKPDN